MLVNRFHSRDKFDSKKTTINNNYWITVDDHERYSETALVATKLSNTIIIVISGAITWNSRQQFFLVAIQTQDRQNENCSIRRVYTGFPKKIGTVFCTQ